MKLPGLVFPAMVWGGMAFGQPQWSALLPASGQLATMRDAVLLDNGNCLAIASMQNVAFNVPWSVADSWLAKISPDGVLASVQPLASHGREIMARTIVRGSGGHGPHILAIELDSNINSGWGIAQFDVDGNGDPIGLSHHQVMDGQHEFFFDGAALDQQDNIFVIGSLYSGINGWYLPDRILLHRMGQAGEEIAQTLLSIQSGLAIGCNVVKQGEFMWTSVRGAQGIGPYGAYKFLRFASAFHYVDGFAGSSVSGSGSFSIPDSMLQDGLSMTLLADGGLISSGRYGATSYPPGTHAAMVRFNPAGTLTSSFLPTSSASRDFPAFVQSHDVEPDGKLVFAVVENYIPLSGILPSLTPSRVHVYLLDSNLTVLCDHVAVDGNADSAYYEVNRIKATADGGTLLIGSRRSINAPANMRQPWIMKLAPWDCHIGIGEHPTTGTASVWPNPGSSGFSVQVNGPVLGHGLLHLFDAQGQLAGQCPVQQSMGRLDATGLAPGIYLYRITDKSGALRATGRWVKE